MTVTEDAIKVSNDGVQILGADRTSTEIPFIWLRDNCQCHECHHPDARERLLDTALLDADIRPVNVSTDGVVALEWEDGHRTEFTQEWLEQNTPGSSKQTEAVVPTPWTSRSIGEEFPEIEYSEIQAGDPGILSWLRLLRKDGFAFVRNVPTRAGAVADVAEQIDRVQETHFGRTFQVRSVPNPVNVSDTAIKLNAHTDVPYRLAVPGLQLLHCREFEAEGGESILVDGFMAATRLKEQDPEAHDLLSSISVPFRFEDDKHDIINRFPVIGVDDRGNYTEIRFCFPVMMPLDIDPALIKPYYRAIIEFARILRDPDLEMVTKMRPGDCQVFDNRRLLHGRGAFNPNSGPRHLEGCYVDADDFASRLRVLEEKLSSSVHSG